MWGQDRLAEGVHHGVGCRVERANVVAPGRESGEAIRPVGICLCDAKGEENTLFALQLRTQRLDLGELHRVSSRIDNDARNGAAASQGEVRGLDEIARRQVHNGAWVERKPLTIAAPLHKPDCTGADFVRRLGEPGHLVDAAVVRHTDLLPAGLEVGQYDRPPPRSGYRSLRR